MTKHAIHNPSSADYWLECGHWYHHKIAAEAAKEDYNPDSDASVRGHRLHDIAEGAMRYVLGQTPDWSTALVENAVGLVIETLELDDQVPAEDFEQVVTALCAVLQLIDTLTEQAGGDIRVLLEKRVRLSHEPDSYGTVDVAIVGPDFLVVLDYKFGAVEVEADANQFWVYASNLARTIPRKKRVVLGVVQPRIREDVLTFETSWDDLVEFRGHVNHTVSRQRAGSAYAPSDISTCNYCPFRDRCVGYTQLVTSATDTLFNIVNDGQIEWVVANRTAITEGVEILAGVVKDQVDRFPNWSRKTVDNPAKWNPAVEPGEIAHQLRLKGVVEPYTLKTPALLRDEYPDSAGVIDKFVLERGTHVRLTRPTSAPDLRAEIKTREISEANEAKAAAKAAKAEAKSKKEKK